MRKYNFTNEFQDYAGQRVNRIVAAIDIVDYKGQMVARKGTLGGWIQKESNLGHDWSCWVADDAIVFENAIVVGDALVKDSCIVHGNAIVADDTILRGVCQIYDHARISGDSNISGIVYIYGNSVVLSSVVSDSSIICGSAVVESSKIKGYSVVSGCTRVQNGCIYTCRPNPCASCQTTKITNYYEVL